ncbi:MAG: hypothetical protein CVV27_06040 [Candidatus Melainabacteria bacterium HGW-Melainabacteria-1]|nr:MAG: hypothetical protein CVV27_06040 [Candidatus Melainabacteria bacterium HGW-Melainabacteria-1]
MSRQTHSSSQSLKLGDLMVRDGLLTTDGLQKALAIQKQGAQAGQYKPLGQVCLDLRLITRQDLQRFLGRYHKHIQIGELLLNMGLISQEQLNRVLDQQRIKPGRLGTLLVKAGVITESQLTDALSMQLGIPRIVPLIDLISPELLEGLEEDFVTRHICLPVHRQGNQIVVVMSDPLNSDLLEALIDRYRCKVVPAIAPSNEILATIQEIFHPTPEQIAQQNVYLDEVPQHEAAAANGGGRDQVNNLAGVLLRSALEASATALHLESHEHYLRVRLRVSGVLRHLTDLPLELGPALMDCFKAPFGQRSGGDQLPATTYIGDQRVELQLSMFPSRWGDNLVMHVYPAPSHLLGLENLGFSPQNMRQYTRLLDSAGGILLAIGPSRSGKSILLRASLEHLNRPACAVLSLDTPPLAPPLPGMLESMLPDEQELKDRLKAMLSHDADVLMINELNDRSSADFLAQAALQGKKVFSALNACDATAGLYRLMQIQAKSLLECPVPMALVAQRLVRRLCENCKISYVPDTDELRRMGMIAAHGDAYPFYRAKGCAECNEHGYRGTSALQEILVFYDSFRDALARGLSAAGIRRLARREGGFVSLAEDGVYKALQGITSLDEVQRVVIPYPDSLPPQTQRDIYDLCQGD